MPRYRVRTATMRDLDLLVRHRRGMWEAIADFTRADLDAADRAYRGWARTRLRSGAFVGFVVESPGDGPVASGCIWLMPSQPRPGWKGTVVPYLLSMFTEPDHRGRGLATRIVRESVRWSKVHGFDTVVLHASRCGESIYAREGFRRTREMRLRFEDRRRRRTGRARRKTKR